MKKKRGGVTSVQDREIVDIFSNLSKDEKDFIIVMAKGLRNLEHKD